MGLALLLTLVAALGPAAGQGSLKVLAWNIWHGGKEDGEAGLQWTIEIIRSSGADLVAMQETYGSGERIAAELGFVFQPRGTNVSIHSRYPILEDISVHKEFQCAGALVELPDGDRVAFYSIWLPYGAEIWEAGTRDASDREALLAACAPSAVELAAMLAAIEERLAGEDYADVPVILAGDFNSMSHLDYGPIGLEQYGAVVNWPTSRIAMEAGFLDVYRACHDPIDRAADATWTPRFPDQEQDRIDYVYLRGAGWAAEQASVIRTHAGGFPSDHGALLATLRRERQVPEELRLRVASYNIRHGAGLDGRVDLERTARVLEGIAPDFVGLQEVDMGTGRSSGQSQMQALARTLSMQATFGKFMDYDGGRYGMGILSAYPVVDSESVPLPEGSEPRVALSVLAQLPGGERIRVINVHFDWIADDADRFAQARVLRTYLAKCPEPFLLVGDFNDLPASRTLELMREVAAEIPKSPQSRFTIPADEPTKEIDYLFCAPLKRWKISVSNVVAERVASDHRPLYADLVLLP